MPKYWVKNYFAHGSFPEVGQKQKTEKKEKKKRRLNDGDNNGQAMHGARKHAWRMQAAWANLLVAAYGLLYCRYCCLILISFTIMAYIDLLTR